jgi:hydroxyacid-oxoacid transhydrogenase
VSDPSIQRLSDEAVGPALSEAIAEFLFNELKIPALKAIGYTKDDIPNLVKGTIPQRRVLDLAPGIGDIAGADGEEHLTSIIEKSLQF